MFGWKRKYQEAALKLERYEGPVIEMIAIVDVYADGRMFRQFEGTIMSDDLIYINTPYAFMPLDEYNA